MTDDTTTRLDHPAGCPRCGAELTELQALFGWACDACQRRARGAKAARDHEAMKHARKVWEYVAATARHNDAKHAPGDGCTSRCFTKALRNYRGTDKAAAVALALDLEWVEARTDEAGTERYFPGPSQPREEDRWTAPVRPGVWGSEKTPTPETLSRTATSLKREFILVRAAFGLGVVSRSMPPRVRPGVFSDPQTPAPTAGSNVPRNAPEAQS